MKISILCILIYVITLCICQDEIEFHCEPKPGCQIAQCAKEFPITCKSKNTVPPRNAGNLLQVLTRNTLDIHELRKENQKQSEKISELEKKDVEKSAQINELEEKNQKQSSQINELKKKNDDFKKQTSEQAAELVRLKKAMARFEEKLNAMGKSQPVTSTTPEITRPTMKTRTTLKPTPSPENCQLKIGNICYFAETRHSWEVTYTNGVEICKKRNADVGLIRDEESYNAIVNLLRQGMPDARIWINIWTGIQFNPITVDVTPADSFTKWIPGFPYTGSSYKDRTNVLLQVDRYLDRKHGMGNAEPSSEHHGVICEIKT